MYTVVQLLTVHNSPILCLHHGSMNYLGKKSMCLLFLSLPSALQVTKVVETWNPSPHPPFHSVARPCPRFPASPASNFKSAALFYGFYYRNFVILNVIKILIIYCYLNLLTVTEFFCRIGRKVLPRVCIIDRFTKQGLCRMSYCKGCA